MIRTFLFAIACTLGMAAHAQNTDTFPRLGGVLIGDPRNYQDASYQEDIAKLDYVIMSVYPGWEAKSGMSMEEVAKRIKAINPKIRIFLYFIPESRRYPETAWSELNAKLDSARWWAYAGGSKVLSDFGRSTYIVNLTRFAPADSSGKRPHQWIAEHAVNTLIKPSPSVDGMFTDNVFWKPRMNPDWNRDGRTDSQEDPAVQKYYREGNVAYLNHLKSLMPGKIQVANVADWGKAGATITEYNQLLPGGVMENLIGKSYSSESWAGWSAMLAHYRKTMAAFAAPKLGMFSQSGLPSDYQSFRYGFATALLDDAYYAFHDDTKGYSGVTWFDEFDVKLGAAASTPPTSAWQKGVWRRDFENGIALVNPKGNGTQTVTLDRDFRKVAGTQDRAVNDGKTVRTLTLRDRDGIVLLRAKRRPRAPGNVGVTASG